jgi:hypothetical protein
MGRRSVSTGHGLAEGDGNQTRLPDGSEGLGSDTTIEVRSRAQRARTRYTTARVQIEHTLCADPEGRGSGIRIDQVMMSDEVHDPTPSIDDLLTTNEVGGSSRVVHQLISGVHGFSTWVSAADPPSRRVASPAWPR